MKATEITIRGLMDGQRTFHIPLFQRTYSWGREQCRALWEDMDEVRASGGNGRHFLGAIVWKGLPPGPEGVFPMMVIDGQQRLTSISILLIALRDALKEGNAAASERISNLYLINHHAAKQSRYKLEPTPADRAAYRALVDGSSPKTAATKLTDAYKYFRSQCVKSDDPAGVERAILDGLEVASVVLDDVDNEHRIFESLNTKGLPLTPADLLRNYFFMRFPREKQEAIYEETWRPMEEAFEQGGASLTDLGDFFGDSYLSSGDFVRHSDVYRAWKKRLDPLSEAQLEEQLDVLAGQARNWLKFIQPSLEKHGAVRRQLERLNIWGGRTAYPFMLWVYQQAELGKTDSTGIARVFGFIESFLVRRMFAGVPTNALNRLFIRLAYQLPESPDLVTAVHKALSEPGKRWPDDQSFRQAILTYKLYQDSRPEQRRLILESLEESYGDKELVKLECLTIEHVLPQTLTGEWRELLGPQASQIHERYIHTLGNLTLTGYNTPMSNRPWPEKRALLQRPESRLAMNKEIAANDTWGEKQIVERGAALSKRAVKIWPVPSRVEE